MHCAPLTASIAPPIDFPIDHPTVNLFTAFRAHCPYHGQSVLVGIDVAGVEWHHRLKAVGCRSHGTRSGVLWGGDCHRNRHSRVQGLLVATRGQVIRFPGGE